LQQRRSQRNSWQQFLDEQWIVVSTITLFAIAGKGGLGSLKSLIGL
jgi:hypothetical protein